MIKIKHILSVLCTIILITCLNSCKGHEDLGKNCDYLRELPLPSEIQANTIIPLDFQNFWVYTDSLWQDGNFKSEKSSLLIIDRMYYLDSLWSVDFSQIIPTLTIRNDTLFSTMFTPEVTEPNCYELLYPMFFATDDSILVDEEPSRKVVYRSLDSVATPVGVFSNNIVYSDGGYFEVIVNEQVGIIKISFFIFNGYEKIKRRTLTLKDYDLQ